VHIEFTGTRPGEKLFEELSAETEGLVGTHHEKIHIFAGDAWPPNELEHRLLALQSGCRERNHEKVMAAMREAAPDYTPGAEVLGSGEAKAMGTMSLRPEPHRGIKGAVASSF